MSELNKNDQQFAGEDEGKVQYQARNYADNKYWVPSLTNTEWSRINRIIMQEVNSTDNYIDEDSKWLYNESRGEKLFGIYSPIDAANPTLLYASTGEQAELEFSELNKIIKELDNGSDRRSKTLDKWFAAYGMLKNRNHSDVRKAPYDGKTVQNDGLDGRTSRSKPSAAFINCIQNITDGRIRELTESVQYQQRSDTLTDREILTMAAEDIQVDNLDAAEADALRIFRERLDTLDSLQEDRRELGNTSLKRFPLCLRKLFIRHRLLTALAI